jgi:hypothetical protein
MLQQQPNVYATDAATERDATKGRAKKEGRAGGTYFNPLSVDCTRRLLLGYMYI